MRMRLFLACYGILLLCLLLLGVVGSRWASCTVRQNTIGAYETSMAHTGQRLEEYLDGLTDVVNLLREDTLLSRIAYMRGDTIDYSRISLTDLREYSKELVFHCASNQLFDDVIVCFPQKNSIVSTLGLWRLDWFFEDEFDPKNLDVGLLQSALEEQSRALFPSLSITSYGQERRGSAFFRRAISTSKGAPLMSVIFWVNASTWRRHLDDLLLCDGQAAALYDENGHLLGACLSGAGPEQAEALLAGWDGAAPSVRLQNQTYLSLRCPLPVSGWQLVSLVPEQAVLGKVRQAELLIALVVLVMAAIGLLVSWKTVKVSFSPVDQLYSTLNSCLNVGEPPSREGMEQVERKLMGVIQEQNRIRQEVENNRPLLQYAALRHLLDGDETSRMLAHQMPLAAVGIKLPHGWLRVLGLYGAADAENCLGTARAVSTGCSMRVYGIRQGELLVLLVNYQEEADLRQLVEQLSPLCRFLCLSDARQTIAQISVAHAHMMETLSQHAIRSDRNIYDYDELPQAQAVRYPDKPERELLAALRSGNAQAAAQVVEQLLAANNSLTQLRKLVTAVELSVLKTEDGRGELVGQLRALPQPDAWDSDGQAAYIRRLAELGAAYHRQAGETQRPALMEKLQLYIDEHICDEQLSLSMLAGHFSVSTAYLSRYFKEQFGMGYLDYVNRKRVLMARDLLANSGATVKETAQRVGFGNDAALRRAFKKYEGTTPMDAVSQSH